MAKLDDLIAHVAEDGLRFELRAAVRELRERKRFGLVFEEHIPEVAVVRGFPIREA